MKLADYMKAEGLDSASLAKKIRVSRQAVDRYLEGRIPEPQVMKRLLRATKDRVTPNDFYDVAV